MRCVAFILCLAATLAAQPAPSQPPPDIVLITMDTVRADRMGFLGSKAQLTPNLDSLARQSLVFTRAYSQAPITPVSHASILTGTYPQFHRVNDFGKPLPPEIPTLASILKERGYATAAFVSAAVLDAKGLAPGFDHGFDVYDAGFRLNRTKKESRYGTVERRAMDVVQRATTWLRQQKGKPVLLWVHLYDAHDPYEPPAPFNARKSKYDGEVAYVDAALGKLFSALRVNRRFTNTMLIATSDHGEALGQHGELTHGVFLYDETIHVPLLVKLPKAGQSRRISEPVQLIDLLPTILETVNVPIPTNVQGRSLLAARDPSTPEVAYSETDYPRRAFGWSSLAALRSDRFLYVKAPQRELYNLERDPKALTNLASGSPAVADTLAGQIEALRAQTQSAGAGVQPVGISPEQAQQLAALGYVGGATEPSSKAGEGIDPKSKVAVANLLHQAILEVEEGRFVQAQPLLEKVIKDDPQIYTAQYQLGLSYNRQQKYAEAVPHLKAATVIQPDSGIANYQLGLALFETGDISGAGSAFEQVLTQNPKWADAHFSLGSVYARSDRIRDALDHLQTALELNPDHFRANLLAGRILSLQGRPDVGVSLLEKAVKLQEKSGEAHRFLADAYKRLGRTREAKVQEALAKTLKP
jgi:arylsulfatase A-like enzyme/Tfp pilus assembly protein PilF